MTTPHPTLSGETVDVPTPDQPAPPRSLRSQVRRNLVRHERDRDDPRLLVPQDRYRYIGELGRGGMGAVLEADDLHLGRRVAIKTVLGDEPARLARFRREARLASQLEHPHIVPVYDLDERDDGGASLAMRKVEGESLGHVIQRMREGLESPRGQAWQLEVLTAVCQAVAYAHAQGIIHRDIKPDNVLLGRFGQVFLTDFGLAKRVDASHDSAEDLLPIGDADSASESFVSQDGLIVGTPAYMAPEQAAGRAHEVDAQTDVYMLGALLYELLTHTRPFAGQRGKALLEAIGSAEPEPPRERAPQLSIPRELEAVALKALSKAKADRYVDVEALLGDLRAFQEGRAISACRDPLGVRLGKWARRHRLLVATALTGLFVTLAAGVTLAVWRDRVRSAELAKLQRRQAATVPYLTGIDLLRRHLGVEAIQDQAIPALERALALDPSFAEARFALGSALLEVYEGEAGREHLKLAVAAQPRNGHWLVKLGEAYHFGLDRRHPAAAGLRAEARRYFLRAAALGEGVSPFATVGQAMVEVEGGQAQRAVERLEPVAERAPHLWEVWHTLGYAQLRAGDPQAGEASSRKALELAPYELLPIRGLAAALLAQGRDAEALPFAEQAAARSDPRLAAELCNLGHVLFRLQRYDEAIDVLERAIARQPDYHGPWLTLGSSLHAVGRTEEALEAMSEAERLGSLEPGLYQSQGSIYMELDRYAEALAVYERALELEPDDAENWANRAYARLRLGQTDEAEADLARAVELDPTQAQVWVMQAGLAEVRGDLEGAVTILDEGLEHVSDVGRLWMVRGLFRLQLGRFAEAVSDLERALELGGSPGAPLPDIGLVLLARAYRQTGDPQRALDVIAAYRDTNANARGLDQEAGIAHFELARACVGDKDLAGALEHLRTSYALEPQEGNATFAAEAAAQLGLIDEAFTWIERAHAHGLRGVARLRSPGFEPLHADPRWQAWLDRLGN